ncbi:MAG: hypothetical protein BWY93_02266 [Euryarchaeota archaeon ADurb.BinA087]|nr:MAG: hypothetical protein BWY93_02266 [Euryarchaeota archaeon ADurb.BinA087]
MNWMWISMFLMSFPVNFFRIALTFLMDSCAISLSIPVAITVPFAPCAMVTSAMIGSTEPESLPMTARPFTLPTRVPSTTVSSYSRLRPMYSSETWSSMERAVFFAAITWSAVVTSTPSCRARSPATRISPPMSRSLRVRWPFRLDLLRASRRISSMAPLSKWGIFPSFLISWAMNLMNFSRFSGVSGMLSLM